jgi:calcineurin-like phosphoesterase family protein
MNRDIISRFNSKVGKTDEVWHLGDFSWDSASFYIDKLNGINHSLILGNHDEKHIKRQFYLFSGVYDVKKVAYMGEKIWVSHYAHARWPASHMGRVHLFGHSHGKFPGIGRSMDVGVDANSFYPISFSEALEKCKAKNIGAMINELGNSGELRP